MNRLLLNVVALCLTLFSFCAQAEDTALPVIDFVRYYPHIIAVSTEKRNEAYPDGLKFKFLSVRDTTDATVWVELVRLEGDTKRVRVFLMQGPEKNSDQVLKKTIDGFAQKMEQQFETFDFRDVKSFAEFQKRAAALGWDSVALSK